MLRDDLMGIINDVCHEELEYVVYSKSDVMGWEKLVKRIAQAIIDRLEIDEDKIYSLLWDDGIIPSGCDHYECRELAKQIAKIKPIKLKGVDK